MSPGPSLLIVSYQTTSFGLKNGIIFSFAHGIGIFLYAFVTAIGIGLLVIKSPILYNFIQKDNITIPFFCLERFR